MTLLMEAEAPASPATEDRPLIVVTERQQCPRCESPFPAECLRALPLTRERAASGIRTVQAYCPRCNAGFEGDFRYSQGIPVAVGPTRLVMGDSTAELRAQADRISGRVDRELREVRETRRTIGEQIQEVSDLLAELQAEAARQARREVELTRRGPIPPDPLPGDARRVPDCPRPTPTPGDAVAAVGSPVGGLGTVSSLAGVEDGFDRLVEHTIDTSTDQRAERERSEPGRDYEPQ